MLRTGFLVVVLLHAAALASAQTPAPATLTVGSWNIEQFGETKSGDPVRLARIADVVATFDVLAVQEIVHAASAGQDVMNRLIDEIGGRHDRDYEFRLGDRVGCTGGRIEQYAVLFDPEIVTVIDTRTIADQDTDPATDDMCRDPFVVRLRMANATASLTLTLVVVHTDPSPAVALREDLNALGRIYQAVQADDAQDDDVILLGDVNAEPSRWNALGAVPDVVYAVPDVGTMVQGDSRNDNILFQWGPTGEDFTGRSRVVSVARLLGITDADADALSDHLPVAAVFFTRRDTQ